MLLRAHGHFLSWKALIFHAECVVAVVIGCRAVFKSQCLFWSAGLSHYIGEETDGQVRRGKPGVLSLSSTKWAADACDFLRDGDK